MCGFLEQLSWIIKLCFPEVLVHVLVTMRRHWDNYVMARALLALLTSAVYSKGKKHSTFTFSYLSFHFLNLFLFALLDC